MTVVLMPIMQTIRAYEFMGVNPPSFHLSHNTSEIRITSFVVIIFKRWRYFIFLNCMAAVQLVVHTCKKKHTL